MKTLTLKSPEKSQSKQKLKDSCPCNQPDLLNSVKQTFKPGNGCVCKDFETFLNKSSLQEPGNIPMVVIRDVVLRATGAFNRKDIVLAMGNVVNGIYKTSDWIFVQTAQGNDGYIPYNSCLPLGIRPPTRVGKELSQLAPWELDNQITQHCNSTDIQKLCEEKTERKNHNITVVCDYLSKNDKQLSVRRGENVAMIQKKNDDWLLVKTFDDREGLIPLAYTSVGKQHFF
uniref:SH3 domain-containing protein n=1 Tax=Strigamia maritima TaxID=126957 RepID=T1J2Q8_STRMM